MSCGCQLCLELVKPPTLAHELALARTLLDRVPLDDLMDESAVLRAWRAARATTDAAVGAR